MNKFKNIALVVVGGLAIHLVLIACSSGVGVMGITKDATTGNTPGLDSAHAQETIAKCTQWEVKAAAPSSPLRLESVRGGTPNMVENVVFDIAVVEAGWEPISSYGTLNTVVLLRRCAK